MPKASTDWKKEHARLGITNAAKDAPEVTRIILEKGERNSVGNKPDYMEDSRGRRLGLMEEQLLRRLRAHGKKRPHPGLKGLFGGGE